jgi:hypothetical protein
MGMTMDQLGVDAPHHVPNVKFPGFSSNLSMKNNLEQQVTQFTAELTFLPAVKCLQHLITLRQQAPPEGGMGLLPVPRAAIRSPQPGNNIQQGVKPI